MDRYKAAILIENLIARIANDPASRQHTLPGVLSANEVVALHVALEALQEAGSRISQPSLSTPLPVAGYVAPPAPDPTAAPAAPEPVAPELTPPEPPATKPTLPLPVPASIDRDRARDVRKLAAERRAVTPLAGAVLCLDFGTARSKAFATTQTGRSVELGLGKRAGEDQAVFAVSSTVWIEEEGIIFAGPSAVSRSRRVGVKHRPFGSLKQELSQGDMSNPPDRTRVPADMNPSSVPLTFGHMITFYLAYLTDLAETELAERGDGLTRYVPRRFALPSWSAERLKWGEELLRRYLARAQIVADVFHGRWREGIDAAEAKAVLDAAASLADADLPLHLILEGVQEPVAAGASRLRADGQRGLVMIVDVGAGTTDFALFVAVENERTDGVRAFQIRNGVRTLRQAGDTLDSLLRQMMVERMGIRAEDPEYRRVHAELLRTIRDDKEALFKTGLVRFNDGTANITRDEFVASDGARRFAVSLRSAFNDTLQDVDASFITGLADGGLKVVLTGGGATLPMVQDLAVGTTHLHGQVMKHTQAPLVPEAFQGSAFETEYPELAVSIGGASDDMPDLRRPVEKWLGSRVSTVKAGNLPITGQ